jgi:hypothetical protein
MAELEAAAAAESSAGPSIPTSKLDFSGWTVDRMRVHLRELELQTSGNKAMLFERLTLHYAGVAQVKKGCSIARTAAAKVGGPPPPTFGANLKCADGGKYGHAGGDEKCSRNVVESTLARGKPLPAFKLTDISNDEAFATVHAMDGTCLQATATTVSKDKDKDVALAPAFAPATDTDVKDGASTQAPAKTQEASSSNTTVLPIDLTLNDVLEWDFVG